MPQEGMLDIQSQGSNTAIVGNDVTGSDITSDAAGILKDLGYEVEGTDLQADPPTGEPEVEESTPEESSLIEELVLGPNEEGEIETTEEGDETEAEESSIFEITHNGEKVTLSHEEVIENAQKGFDYTKKTQMLADEKKAFEKEVEDTKTEFETLLKQETEKYQGLDDRLALLDKWDYFFDSMKTSNPDLFEQIQDDFQTSAKQFDNPMVKAQMDRMSKELEAIKSQGKDRENEVIRAQFDQEFKTLMGEVGERAERLGLKVNKDKIRDAWTNHAQNAKQAFFLIHGEELFKRTVSKGKTEAVKKVVKGKAKSPTLKKGAPKKTNTINLKNLRYDELAQQIASGKIPI